MSFLGLHITSSLITRLSERLRRYAIYYDKKNERKYVIHDTFPFDKDTRLRKTILVLFLSIQYRTQIQLGHDTSRMGLNIDFQFLLRGLRAILII